MLTVARRKGRGGCAEKGTSLRRADGQAEQSRDALPGSGDSDAAAAPGAGWVQTDPARTSQACKGLSALLCA